MSVTPAPARTIQGLDELRSLVGQEIGVSEWRTIDQELIDRFADCTGDHQWIHVDVERCKRESPFGTTIAHGFLILSLAAPFAFELFTVSDVALAVNYGLDKVRFVAPVPSGSRVRMRVTVEEVREARNGQLARFGYTFEREGEEKPVCVAQGLALFPGAS